MSAGDSRGLVDDSAGEVVDVEGVEVAVESSERWVDRRTRRDKASAATFSRLGR